MMRRIILTNIGFTRAQGFLILLINRLQQVIVVDDTVGAVCFARVGFRGSHNERRREWKCGNSVLWVVVFMSFTRIWFVLTFLDL